MSLSTFVPGETATLVLNASAVLLACGNDDAETPPHDRCLRPGGCHNDGAN